jgi:phosphate transport system substrate-binding protein
VHRHKYYLRWAAAAGALAALLAALPASGQTTKTIFCFTDGTKVGAEKFETKDGKFLLYVGGSATPLEYPAAKVCSVNVEPCACTPPPPPPPPPPPTPDTLHFGIHGSNTIGERLMPALIEAYARKTYQAAPVTKLTKTEELEITINSGSETKAIIDFQSHGSGTAAKGLAEGKAQIGMASRQLKPPEADLLRQTLHIDPFAPDNEHVLALDGLAVIVHPQNAVTKLTLEQIGRIFAGQIANWKDVGGADAPITIFRRDDKSGTFDTFKALALDPQSLKIAPQAQKFESSELLAENAGKDPNSIGFVALPYVSKANRALDIAGVCGLSSSATRFAVKSEEYPLARRLFLYTAGEPSHPEAAGILHFALSDEAQPVIAENEFINLAVDFQTADEQAAWVRGFADNSGLGLGAAKPVPAQFVRAFVDAMEHYRRSTMEFRFRSGSADLDNRALQDIERLSRYLKAPENADKKFQIVGFADSDGLWSANWDLAGRRAVAVAQLLAQRGVRIDRNAVRSMSYMAPVACNDDDAGRSKNRRVEIWIE